MVSIELVFIQRTYVRTGKEHRTLLSSLLFDGCSVAYVLGFQPVLTKTRTLTLSEEISVLLTRDSEVKFR